jgi:hypothetical protein
MKFYNIKDLTGKKFGKWKVLGRYPKQGKANQVMWLCLCKCGNKRPVISDSLTSGRSKSCRACSPVLAGQIYGRWEVVRFSRKTYKGGNRYCLCRCTCSNHTERPVKACSLRNSTSTSCGCLRRENMSKRVRKRPYEHLYNLLVRMSKRNEKGCTLTFEQFLKFTEQKQCHYCHTLLDWAPHSNHKESNSIHYNVDRKDSSLGYSKDNCVACCGDCNFTKSDKFTQEEFMLLVPVLRRIRRARKMEV